MAQNLAEDFGWIPGFLDATAPLIAAITALLIAFVAYPWQKSRDRALKINEEKRAAYQRFLRATTEHQMRLSASLRHKHDYGIGDSTPKAIAMSYELVTYAPKDVIEICQRYVATLYVFEEQVWALLRGEVAEVDYEAAYKASRLARRNAVLAIRKDVTGETDAASEAAISAFFGETLTDYNAMHDRAVKDTLKSEVKSG